MFMSTSTTNGSILQVTEFILMGFPGIHSWQHWLSLPLALLYLSALLANAMILLTIWQETALRQPMFYFLAVLALVDMGLSTTIMPRILAMLCFNARTISLSECFFQIYAIHVFVGLESSIFLCMAIDRYMAICHPLHYPFVITEGFVLKATLFMVFRNDLLAIPLPVLAARCHYSSRNEIDHCLCLVPSWHCDTLSRHTYGGLDGLLPRSTENLSNKILLIYSSHASLLGQNRSGDQVLLWGSQQPQGPHCPPPATSISATFGVSQERTLITIFGKAKLCSAIYQALKIFARQRFPTDSKIWEDLHFPRSEPF
ncbi:olfactory receptor 56B1-like [Tachyglossus aculeatus]|uniref:olfactory receptor 56B1-like n=1 Tax=Tachyglossus aculeatus TaxID=9261 RepID=UPI0018F56F78|nr:olfactory receptor 56B1-like [Tachyglossus aculeatus]